jgi:two-component system, cell cycle response regulator DivK
MSILPDARGKRPRILLVDDYGDTRELFAEILAMAGFDVVQAADGEEGLARAPEILPDLIVTDLTLPDVDGCEVARRLKDDDRTRGIPIIALSAHGAARRAREALEAGCVSFVPKTSQPGILVDEIRRILGNAA